MTVQDSNHPYSESETGKLCPDSIQQGDSRGTWINLQNSDVTRRNNVSPWQGGRSKLSRLLSEKHNRKKVEHCEQSPRGGGMQDTSYINDHRPSKLIKKFDAMLSAQSSPPKSNTVHEIGFDDRKENLANDPWAKTPSGSDCPATAVSSTCRLMCPSSQIRPPIELEIGDQAQIFDLGAQRESDPAYVRKREILYLQLCMLT